MLSFFGCVGCGLFMLSKKLPNTDCVGDCVDGCVWGGICVVGSICWNGSSACGLSNMFLDAVVVWCCSPMMECSKCIALSMSSFESLLVSIDICIIPLFRY